MNKQFMWALVATLGLAGCGGGGGGGGSDDSDDLPNLNNVSASNLVGTWIQTNVNFADPMDTGSYEWVKTKRETIVVTRSGSGLIFTNCVTGNAAAANLADGVVTFPAFPAWELDVVNGSTMTMTLVQADSETEVELRKVTSSTRAVLADIEADVDLEGTSVSTPTWNQVCVETVVDKYEANTIDMKASGSENGVSGTVRLIFSTESYFVAGQYDYPEDGNITGNFSISSFVLNTSGNLSNPSGTMVMVENDTTDMYVNVVLDSSSTLVDTVGIDGTISLDPEWLAQPSSP